MDVGLAAVVGVVVAALVIAWLVKTRLRKATVRVPGAVVEIEAAVPPGAAMTDVNSSHTRSKIAVNEGSLDMKHVTTTDSEIRVGREAPAPAPPAPPQPPSGDPARPDLAAPTSEETAPPPSEGTG